MIIFLKNEKSQIQSFGSKSDKTTNGLIAWLDYEGVSTLQPLSLSSYSFTLYQKSWLSNYDGQERNLSFLKEP